MTESRFFNPKERKKKISKTHSTLFCPQVDVLESASVSDVVVISLNQPANVVEKKKTELET